MSTDAPPSKAISDAIAELHAELIYIGAGKFSEFVGDAAEMAAFVNRVSDAIWNEPGHRQVLDAHGCGRDRVNGLYVHAFAEAVESRFTRASIATLLQIYGSPFGLSRLMATIAQFLQKADKAKLSVAGSTITGRAIRMFYLTLARDSET